MRTQVCCLLVAGLGITVAHAGCRALGGLGDLQFDLADAGDTDGGETGGGGGTGGHMDAGPDTDADADADADAGTDADAGADAEAGCAPSGYLCGDPVPSGWVGPVALYEGAPGTLPSCPSGYPNLVAQGTAGVDAQPATCSACTCGTPTASCSQAALDVATGCAAQPTTVMLDPMACTPAPQTGDRFILHPPQAGVSCQPSGGTPTLPPLVWATAGIACGAQPIACGDGTECAPPPPAPFAQKRCILSMTAAACPPEFPDSHIWETASEGRGCTPCTCTGSGSTCSGLVGLHDDTVCQHLIGSVSSNGQCVQKPGVKMLQLVTTSLGTPSCQKGGGAPTGSVSTTPAVSVCCAP